MSFEVVSEYPSYTPDSFNVVVGQDKYPLYEASDPVSQLRDERAIRSIQIDLPECLPVEFLRVNGEPWNGEDLASRVGDISQALVIDGGAFGTLKVAAHTRASMTAVTKQVIQTATWLLSLPRPQEAIGAVAFPSDENLPTELRPLLERKWDAKYGPYVMNLWRSLQSGTSI
jgi:hypothetical protein